MRVTFERKGKEQSVKADKVLMAVGRRPVVVTSAKNNEEAKALLTELGMPFAK